MKWGYQTGIGLLLLGSSLPATLSHDLPYRHEHEPIGVRGHNESVLGVAPVAPTDFSITSEMTDGFAYSFSMGRAPNSSVHGYKLWVGRGDWTFRQPPERSSALSTLFGEDRWPLGAEDLEFAVSEDEYLPGNLAWRLWHERTLDPDADNNSRIEVADTVRNLEHSTEYCLGVQVFTLFGTSLISQLDCGATLQTVNTPTNVHPTAGVSDRLDVHFTDNDRTENRYTIRLLEDSNEDTLIGEFLFDDVSESVREGTGNRVLYLYNSDFEEIDFPELKPACIRVRAERSQSEGVVRSEYSDKGCGFIGPAAQDPDETSEADWTRKAIFLLPETIFQGPIPYAGSLLISNAVIRKVVLHGADEHMVVRFVKVGKTTEDCSDTGAVVPVSVSPGSEVALSADQIKSIYGTPTPPAKITFVGCVSTADPSPDAAPDAIQLDVWYEKHS